VIDLPQPTGSHLWPTEDPGDLAPLHRPRRAFVALAEVVVAAVIVWLAFLCWKASSVTLTTTLTDGTRLISTRDFGGRIAGAIGLGVLAALLIVDAVRQLLLATRVRPKKAKRRSTGRSQQTAS
jgi:hypothetical protein